jgi:fatty acid-binding protein 3
MKEIGVGLATRMLAKGLKPRIIISEDNGKWTIRSETTLKTVVVDFTPGVEFNETTPDGREVTVCYTNIYTFRNPIFILKSTINFEGDKWIHTSVDKNGKKSVVIRYIDSNGQLMIVSLSLDFSIFFINDLFS